MNTVGNSDYDSDSASITLLGSRSYDSTGSGIKKAVNYDFKCIKAGTATLNIIFGSDMEIFSSDGSGLYMY